MLQTIQIIAFLQGCFLLVILFKNKKKYFFTDFFYLSAALFSLLLYLLGDDNSNLLFSGKDFFLVDSTLFITFLFLFLKNFNSYNSVSIKNNFIFFIPVICYILIELYEIEINNNIEIELIEHLIYFIFIIYLLLSIYYSNKNIPTLKIRIPFYILIISLLVAYSSEIFTFFNNQNEIDFFHSLLIIETAILFYYLSYIFIFYSNFIQLPKNERKYKNSTLEESNVDEIYSKLEEVMNTEKLFLNPDLTLHLFSEKVNVPKHYISEVLNTYKNKTFTQFVNEFRIREFIKIYLNDKNNQYSIFGIANTVGFKNKSTFNSTFKKITGYSPSEYKEMV